MTPMIELRRRWSMRSLPYSLRTSRLVAIGIPKSVNCDKKREGKIFAAHTGAALSYERALQRLTKAALFCRTRSVCLHVVRLEPAHDVEHVGIQETRTRGNL